MNSNSTFPRRSFLTRLADLGLAGLIGQGLVLFRPPAAFGAKPARAAAKPAPAAAAAPDPMAGVTAEEFVPFIGSHFRVIGARGQSVDIRLLSVTLILPKSIAKPVPLPRPPFSLLFSGPPQNRFPQDTYLIQHATIAPFRMFLVPIGSPKAAPRYEAIFG